MSASFRCDGRLFHSPGPAAPNALSPKVLYVRRLSGIQKSEGERRTYNWHWQTFRNCTSYRPGPSRHQTKGYQSSGRHTNCASTNWATWVCQLGDSVSVYFILLFVCLLLYRFTINTNPKTTACDNVWNVDLTLVKWKFNFKSNSWTAVCNSFSLILFTEKTGQ